MGRQFLRSRGFKTSCNDLMAICASGLDPNTGDKLLQEATGIRRERVYTVAKKTKTGSLF